MSRNQRTSALRNKRRESLANLKKAKEEGISRTELLEVNNIILIILIILLFYFK